VLCLRVLHASVTLLIQDVLADGGLQLTVEDRARSHRAAPGDHGRHARRRRRLVAGRRGTGDAPQAAFEAYGHLADGHKAPAAQRPALAIVITAGLDSEHDVLPEYGIDIDDLGPDHSVNADPGVIRIRDAARLLGARTWITVTIPGSFQGAEGEPEPGDDAISQWASVVTAAEELTWLTYALAMNTIGSEDPDDDLD